MAASPLVVGPALVRRRHPTRPASRVLRRVRPGTAPGSGGRRAGPGVIRQDAPGEHEAWEPPWPRAESTLEPTGTVRHALGVGDRCPRPAGRRRRRRAHRGLRPVLLVRVRARAAGDRRSPGRRRRVPGRVRAPVGAARTRSIRPRRCGPGSARSRTAAPSTTCDVRKPGGAASQREAAAGRCRSPTSTRWRWRW